jgi:hypothetical protein
LRVNVDLTNQANHIVVFSLFILYQ